MLVFVLCITAGLYAQNVKKPEPAKTTEHKKDTSTVPFVPTYLGKTFEYKGGQIPKAKFDELLHKGITAKDSLGNVYNVIGFTFSYVERNLYEDSVGKLQIMSEYLSEYCPGDTLPADIAASIYERTKQKDTAYFDGITLRKQSDGAGAYGKPMRFIITK